MSGTRPTPDRSEPRAEPALDQRRTELETDGVGIEVRWYGQPTCVVTVTGELDVATAPDLNATIRDVLSRAPMRLVIDLDQVTFLDSTGLGVLVSTHQRVSAEAGEFVLVCHNRNCLRVMEITALTRVFAFAPSVDEAVEAAIPDTAPVRPIAEARPERKRSGSTH
jgi:anti-sigma B factor antagonist